MSTPFGVSSSSSLPRLVDMVPGQSRKSTLRGRIEVGGSELGKEMG